MSNIVTYVDQACDPSLTEHANAPGISNEAESWADYLRRRIANGDTGEEPTDEPYGDHLIREWHRLSAKFATRPQSFPDLRRAISIGVIDQDEWDHWVYLKHLIEPPQARAKNGRPKGAWELTLTYSPKWYQDDLEAQEAFRTAERKLLKYYRDELEQYRSVGEYTSDGRAHLHILYRLGSGGKFTDKNLRRAYPHWNTKIKVGKGNQGGHHAPAKSVADLYGYIEKELTTAWHDYTHNHADDTASS